MSEDKRITPAQIVDDWFHEYTEGRCDRQEMIDIIMVFAMQYHESKTIDLSRDTFCPICGDPYSYIYTKDHYQKECDCDIKTTGCPYCGEQLTQAEYDSVCDCGCPSCRKGFELTEEEYNEAFN